ncbi:MAG: ISL3 family transposase [Streptosporangiaceae bacterium]|nr:ISL3 family transposase [Streptosporangiaceae bacterium]
MVYDTASALFGVEGLRVTDTEAGAGGAVEVWVVTGYPDAAACPECGTVSDRVHETVVTRPRDARRAGDAVDLHWVKVRRKCGNRQCPRKTFTEWVPQVPARCRITARLREQAAHEVTGRGITPAEAARHAGISWPVAHDAFAAAADPVLDQVPAPVAHLGIDEHRRGRARFAVDEYLLLADRWHTCFFDLDGQQGLLGQVQGRTADDAAYWLAGATPAWRDAVQVVCIDLCSIYASAVRRMLPHATLTADLFHVVQLAVKMAGDVRRRVVRARYRRRGRSGDPEYGIKGLLVRNLENLAPAQFTKIMDTLGGNRYGQEILAAWIAKEKLRDALNLRARITGSTPCERDVRGRLFTFYDWCAQHDDIPELVTLARTISRWENEIVAAVITGVTNATSESLNRLAKLEARQAYGFRNPHNQQRRVRIACTRGYRHRSRTVARSRTRTVT